MFNTQKNRHATKAYALRQGIFRELKKYARQEDISIGLAVSAVLADVRHICDSNGLDYGRCDDCAYSFYCEENGQEQAR